jgi:hypothetical protein
MLSKPWWKRYFSHFFRRSPIVRHDRLRKASLQVESLEARDLPSSTPFDIPMAFEANQGQTDAEVQFLSRGAGYGIFLTSSEAVLRLVQPAALDGSISESVVRMQMVGSNPTSLVQGVSLLEGKSNYFTDTVAVTNVANYEQVQYSGIYSGIDLVFHGNPSQLQYDFLVAAGADPNQIRLNFAGADQVSIDDAGNLVIRSGSVDVKAHAPVVYQIIDGVQQSVDGSYVLLEGNQVGFVIGAYDVSQPLVIDPTLVYGTFNGGSGVDQGFGVAVDSAGNAYVTGLTNSATFPMGSIVGGGGNFDVFVTKFNAAGTARLYTTYFGGSGDDRGYGIAVNNGEAYVSGYTASPNFATAAPNGLIAGATNANPIVITSANHGLSTGNQIQITGVLGNIGANGTWTITAIDGNSFSLNGSIGTGAYTSGGAWTLIPAQATHGGGYDAFVTKLNTSGGLAYSTYLGGTGNENNTFYHGYGNGIIAVDSDGNAWVTGMTESNNFFTSTNALRRGSVLGGRDAFVTRVNATGTAFDYSTLLGGNSDDRGAAIAVDSAGKAYVTGFTVSDATLPPSPGDFPASPGAFQGTRRGGWDAYVAKFDASLSGSASRVYASYLGGTWDDFGQGIAVDGAGNAYVTGMTYTGGVNFPTVNALQSTAAGAFDGFVTKVNATGTALEYSTFFGGSGEDWAQAIAVDAAGNAHVTGFTNSSNLPLVNSLRGSYTGSWDSFALKLTAAGNNAYYSTYLGGNGDDRGQGIALDSAGNAYIAGLTSGGGFLPTTTGAAQPGNGGDWDGFLFKLVDTANHAPTLPTIGTVAVNKGSTVTLDASAADPDGNIIYNVQGLPAGATFDPTTHVLTWTPPPTDAVGWWNGNANLTTATDVAGANPGTLVNGATTTAQGKAGQGFILDGIDDYVDLGNSAALNPDHITVEAWWYGESFAGSGNNAIVSKGFTSHTNPYYQYHLGVTGDQYPSPSSAGRYSFSVTVGGTIYSADSASDTYAVGAWNHFVGTYDGETVRLYRNGILVGENTAPSGVISDYASSVRIGAYSNPSGDPILDAPSAHLPGRVDEVSIFSRALSTTEVQSIYAAGSEGKGSTGAYSRTITVTATDSDGFSNDAVNSWRGEGNADDGGSRDQDGVFTANTYTPGLVGDAFSFDGTNKYVKLPDNFFSFPTTAASTAAADTPFTFETWFKATPGTSGVILAQQTSDPFTTNPSGFVPGVYVGTDGLLRAEMFWKGSVEPIVSSTTVNDGAFHHVAITSDGATQTMYLDGVAVGIRTYTQQVQYANVYKYQLGTGYTAGRAGGAATGVWHNFNGLIDETAIYQRVLTPQEVRAIAQAGSAGKAGITGLSDTETIKLVVNATPVTSTTNPPPTAAGSALKFDGFNDYVEIDAASELHSDRQLTVSGWFKVDAFPRDWQNILFKGNASGALNREYALWVNNTGYLLFTYGSTTTAYSIQTASGVIHANQWHHFAAVVDADSATTRLYFDGQLLASGIINTSGIVNSGGPLRFGRAVESWDNGLTGSLDDIRIYDIARTQSQIVADANLPLTGTEANLRGYWNFDENSGATVTDLTGNGNDGSLAFSALPAWVAGQSGTALLFDGSNNYVQIGNRPSLTMTGKSQMTAEAWVYPTVEQHGAFIAKEGEYLVARLWDGTIGWAFYNANPGWAWHSTGYVLPMNQGSHVAVVYDATIDNGAGIGMGSVRTYVNGTLVETFTPTNATSLGPILGGGNDFRIGSRTGFEYFAGRVDEVRIWDVVRDQADIQANQGTPLAGTEPGLQGYWRFNEGLGTTVADLTANDNDGTLSGRTIQQGVAGALTGDVNTAYRFAGGAIDLTLPQVNTAVGGFNTVSFWMNWDGTNAVMPFGFSNYDLFLWDGRIGFNTATGDLFGVAQNSLTGGLAPLTSRWVHVTAAFSNGDITQSRLWIDGVEQSLSQLAGSPATRTATMNARLSGWTNDTSYGFWGSLDEFVVHNRLLTGSEIAGQYNARASATYSTTVLATSPIAYYRLGESSGSLVADASPYQNDGNIGNHPTFTNSGALIYNTIPTVTITVLNTADTGAGSLRQAILDANALAAGLRVNITFNIASSDPNFVDVDALMTGGDAAADVYVIQPLTPLPTITRANVTIDGRTQTAFGGNTNTFGAEIVLDGQGQNSGSGLQLNSGNNTIAGLNIQRFRGHGILVNGASDNIIIGNYIGTNATGTQARGNFGSGIFVTTGARNRIGTDGDNVNDVAEANVISGNNTYGVWINGGPAESGGLGTAQQWISGEIPTVTATATLSQADLNDPSSAAAGWFTYNNAIPGGGGDQYVIRGTGQINVTQAGVYTFALSGDDGGRLRIDGQNVISDNTYHGLQNYFGQVNLSVGVHSFEWIGFEGGGASGFELSVAVGAVSTGSLLNSNLSTVGFKVLGDPTPHSQIALQGSIAMTTYYANAANVVAGNFIGTNAAGTAALGNLLDGVFINGSSKGNRIGTDGSNDAFNANERNIISGNRQWGVDIRDLSHFNVVAGNYIGTNKDGNAPVANAVDGVFVYNGSQFNRIGTNADGIADVSERNVISGNAQRGVRLQSEGVNVTTNNTVAGNYIGTNKDGNAAVANAFDGVWLINGARGNIIGTNADGINDTAERNIISGNTQRGIRIEGANTDSNIIAGNYIGTDYTGAAPLANVIDGVLIISGARANIIGGELVAQRNVISGNTQRGIRIESATTVNNIIAGNYIGTDYTGTQDLGNVSDGILIFNAAKNNLIGGYTDGARNIISGNNQQGVNISGVGTSGNIVAGNYIGLTANGNGNLGNSGGGGGVFIQAGATGNIIGGPQAGARNVISGNNSTSGDGVEIDANGGATAGNIVQGNYIGTDATGTLDRGNVQAGVLLDNSPNNLVLDNLISGNNALAGVFITLAGATGNIVQGNRIGTNALGTAAIGNSVHGVQIANAATNNLIGTDGDGAGDADEGNLISGNLSRGVIITNAGTNNNRVAGNRIGTNFDGTAALPNASTGVEISTAAAFNIIGTNDDGNGDLSEGNLISGNSGRGVFITGAGTNSNRVAGNFIGTDALGNASLANLVRGVDISGSAQFNIIGTNGTGDTIAERNVISGNTTYGVLIQGTNTNSNIVAGNYIGTNAAGDAAVPNTEQGVVIFNNAKFNRIGTDNADLAEANLISGNTSAGVSIVGAGADQNIVAGNYIGTGAGGVGTVGNGGSGVAVSNAMYIVEAEDFTSRSSPNAHSWVEVPTESPGFATFAGARGAYLQALPDSGLIGTANLAPGVSPYPNSPIVSYAVHVTEPGVYRLFVRMDGFDGNSDSLYARILELSDGAGGSVADWYRYTTGGDASFVTVPWQGSAGFERTDAAGGAGAGQVPDVAATWFFPTSGTYTVQFAVREDGVALDAFVLQSNGLAAAPTGTGPLTTDATPQRNSIRGNFIAGNGGLGIDLGANGLTANDLGDADTGPNTLQNFPVLTDSIVGPTTTHIFGSLNSTPSTTYTLDFFANPATDAPGFEGRRYLGSMNVTTDAAGNASFDATLQAATSASEYFTATATDPLGNTSEFSAALWANHIPSAIIVAPATGVEGGLISVSANVDAGDAGDTVTGYSWSVTKNGVAYGSIGTSPTFSFTPDDDGAYVVSLIVTDAQGSTGSDSETVTITNLAPVVDAGPDVIHNTLDAAFGSGSFSDAGAADTFTATVDYGDGNGVQPLALNLDKTFTLSHTYAADGVYSVTVTIFDDDNESHSDTIQVTVNRFTVNTSVDTIASDNVLSLREAILNANGFTGPQTIAFNIPGSGVHTINVTSALPTITDAIIIDGYTQAGSSANTLAIGNDAVLQVALHYAGTQPDVHGLTVTGSGVAIKGLIINSFSGNGIFLSGDDADNNVIEGNFIGTDAQGAAESRARPQATHSPAF